MSESPKFDIFQRLEDKFPVKFMQQKGIYPILIHYVLLYKIIEKYKIKPVKLNSLPLYIFEQNIYIIN